MIWFLWIFLLQPGNVPTVPSASKTDQLDAKTQWELANQAYQNGEYELARDHYEALVNRGIQNGDLHFNLGNAYFKTGQIGPSILHYEKALHYEPFHADINHNLKRALAARANAKSDPNADVMAERIRKLMYALPFNLIFWMTLLLILVSGLGWTFIVIKGMSPQLRVLIGVLSLLSLLTTAMLLFQHRVLNTHDRGVILMEEATVRSGPSPSEEVSFSVYEGKRVTILDRTNGWLRVRLSNGYNGWIREGSVGII